MTEANISGLPRHADIHTGPQTTECAADIHTGPQTTECAARADALLKSLIFRVSDI